MLLSRRILFKTSSDLEEEEESSCRPGLGGGERDVGSTWVGPMAGSLHGFFATVEGIIASGRAQTSEDPEHQEL